MEYRLYTGPSPFGSFALVWSVAASVPKIHRIFLSSPDVPASAKAAQEFPCAQPGSQGRIETVAGRIAAFLLGDDVRFDLEDVRLDLCSEFQRKVLRAEHGIPRGRVSTYGRIAGHLGRPGSARAVGNCLARNPFPIIVPCHRAIRSDGSLGGYQGGIDMKRALLEMEGVRFDTPGRIVAEEFYYK
jgi:methylated-DNA-[protein]-cysteine S-methyltransferase